MVGGRIGGYEVRNASAVGQAEQSITYSYDSFGRMDEISDGSDTFTYTYKADTNLLEILSQNNRNIVYTYEANRDMIISLDNRSAANTRISNYGYVYDSLGLRTQRSKAGSVYATQSTDTFSYNTRNELVSQNNTHTYAYDSIGNRTSSTENGITKTYTTNSLNQYTAIGEEVPVYDADGNQTSDGTKKYVYNAENRLIAVEPMSPAEGDIRIEYSYDYLGRKALKRTFKYINSVAIPQKTEYYIYLGKYEIAVYEDGTERTRYLWGLDASQTLEGAGGAGGLLKAVERTGEHAGAKYFRYDAEGNVRQIVDSSDNVVAYYEYDPFGKLISKGGTYADANRYRHATKPYDEDTGLYYYTYRHYNPESGRWINRDPIAEEGGLNLYAFCVNNGINLWDLWGNSKDEKGKNKPPKEPSPPSPPSPPTPPTPPKSSSKNSNNILSFFEDTGAEILEAMEDIGEGILDVTEDIGESVYDVAAYIGEGVLQAVDFVDKLTDIVGDYADGSWNVGLSYREKRGYQLSLESKLGFSSSFRRRFGEVEVKGSVTTSFDSNGGKGVKGNVNIQF